MLPGNAGAPVDALGKSFNIEKLNICIQFPPTADVGGFFSRGGMDTDDRGQSVGHTRGKVKFGDAAGKISKNMRLDENWVLTNARF